MAQGAVRWFDLDRGIGFIQPDNGEEDVFVHFTAVEQAGLPGLTDGQKVVYDVSLSRDGREFATNLGVD